MVMQDHAALHTLEVLGSLVEEEALEALPEAMRMMILVVLMMMILLVLMAGTCSCIGAGAVSTRMGIETPPLPTSNYHQTPRIPYSYCCCCSVTKSALCTLHFALCVVP